LASDPQPSLKLYPAVQKSEVAGEDHRLTPPPMHFRQICSVRTRIRLEVAPPGGGSTGEASLPLVCRPPDRRLAAQTRIWRNPRNSTYRVGLSSRGRLA